MEVGTEISQKIRSAIKAKLMELGAYVDDELPDYIMVMVANKKNKSQMKNDLGLFLGNNTDAFTTWLHGLLGKLQTITVDSGKGKSEKSKVSKEKKKNKEGKSSKGDCGKKEKKNRKRKSSHDNVEGSSKAKKAIPRTESEVPVSANSETISEAITEDNTKSVEPEESEASSELLRQPDTDNTAVDPVLKENVAQEDIEDVRQLLVTVAPGDDLAQELDAVEEEVVNLQSTQKLKATAGSKAAKEPKENTQRISTSSTAPKIQEQKTKRKLPSSVVATVSRDQDEEEYDPFNPAVGNVASVVKVTTRKATVPLSMQANRTLLVKAMSEAEKSVATKKKVAVTRPINRNDSPMEYSPKRKQPSGSGKRASPPPYIPSKKMRSEAMSDQSTRAMKQKRTLSKDDVRHTLGRDTGQKSRIISASRKEELLKAMGITKSKSASSVTSAAHGVVRRVETGSESTKGKSDRISEGGTYARQVRGEDAQTGGIKNLQITARVGPIRAVKPTSSDSKKSPVSPESSKRALQLTIVAGDSKSKNVGGKDETETTYKTKVRRDAREDIQAARKGKAVSSSAHKSGGRVLSKSARDAVQKQCQAAVMSVKKMPIPASKSKNAKPESPDSRVVRCDSDSPVIAETDILEEEDSDDTTEVVLDIDNSDRAASVDSESGKTVSVAQRKSPSSEPESLTELASLEEEKTEAEDVEDLSHMLEGEDLDSQLLLKEEEDKNEFNLDLDDEDLSRVVDDVNVDIEEDDAQSKSSTRFIVTLDGVDVTQFKEDNSGKSIPAIAESQAQSTLLSPPNPRNPPPVATLMPNSLSQPAIAIASPHPQRLGHTIPQPVSHALPQPLPQALPTPMAQPLVQPLPLAPIQASTAPSLVAAKPRPPKIQPFSISLRDSDDEHEEKIVTYVQAGDITAAGNVSVTDDTSDELSSLQRARQQERCRFWPACMAGTECQYHHPTTHCKTFPNCKFGDKCLFIHPNCRFDSKCVRPDCPFTHSSKRRLPQAVVTTIHAPRHYPRFPAAPPQSTTVCHYFPNCLNPNCQFAHPKPCMYGAACKNPVCAFYHPEVQPPANVGNLKWQAQVSSQSSVNKSSSSVTKTTAVSS